MLKDYSKTTLNDVEEIARTIRALRLVAKESKVQTSKTQSHILRELPADVLTAVALKLQGEQLVEALGSKEAR